MMTQLLCNYLHTCSASPSRHNSYSMSQCCHDAPLVPPKLWRGDTGQTGAWSQLVQSPLLWEHRHQPPQLHCHHILTSTVTHLHHRISSLLSLGADVSALMSYAGTAAVSLLVYNWCVHLGLEPTVQQRRVTRAESWARLRGGSSVYSAVPCSTPPYR